MKADIIIIGGGASGLTAAIAAAREGARVLIIEQMPRIGKKILATGNGRCNYTNEHMGIEYYHSQHPELAEEILKAFGTEDTLKFFSELGIPAKAVNGYIYPNSMQAASILDSLRFELERLKVSVLTDQKVTDIRHRGKGYQVFCDQDVFHCRRVIMACGGKASEKLGSNGSGYRFAKTLGHRIVPVVPALTGLKAGEAFYKSLSGIRTEGKVSLYIDGILTDTHRGEIQLAEYGISGIPVFQLSSQAAYGLMHKKQVYCALDFFPDVTLEALEACLKERCRRFKNQSVEAFETGLLNRKLMQACLKLVTGKTNPWPDPVKLAGLLKAFPATIIGSRGYDYAQVCAGGVSLEEIHLKNCESRIHPGCYIVGELLDADGICGGYNLQWAWATGILAGSHAGKECYDSNQSN